MWLEVFANRGSAQVLFIGIALLVAVGIAVLIGADAGSFAGLTQMQIVQLVPLVVILIVIAGGLFSRRRGFRELMGGLAIWIGIFGVVIVGYALRDDIYRLSGRVMGELRPGVAVVDPENGTARFQRDMGGHFDVQGKVNGTPVTMIFDTGASAVVLTEEDAQRAGINTKSLNYTLPVSTANGEGRAAAVMLGSINVGGIERDNIRAYVTESGALETSLLGMTFLETLQRYAVSSDALELTD